MNGAESFSYTVTDANGNTVTGTITINVIDDVPTAHVDSGNVNEGGLLTVAAAGVLSNDVAGADGFAAGGGVVGVRAAGGDLTTDVTTGVATPITGLHGTLHLNADGSYTYQSTANNITADTTDVFVYTVKDGDGDLSTTTLTINLANVTLAPRTTTHRQRDRTGYDGHRRRPCGRHGDGLEPGDRRRRRMRATSSRFGRVRHADLCAGERRQRGDGGHLRHDPGQCRRHLLYTLTTPVTEPTANNGADTVNGAESFTYRGDRRHRQHRDRHDHDQHHRRRADGACGQWNVTRARCRRCGDRVEANDMAGADGSRLRRVSGFGRGRRRRR